MHTHRVHRKASELPGSPNFTRGLAQLLEHSRDVLAGLTGETGVYRAITRLPERQCDVVILHCVMELPEEKVARLLGMTTATVRSHLRHARARLERWIDTTGLDLPTRTRTPAPATAGTAPDTQLQERQ